MNDKAIALERASRHSHTVNPAVRNCYCYNLRAKRWEIRKTDCLELNLFATQEAFAQITQGKAKPKPGKRPSRFNFNRFGHTLMILADVCAGDSSQEIHSELSLRRSMFRFFPGPFFLDQLWLLSKLRVFLIDLAGGKFVSDNDMQPIVFYPLPEFAVSEFLPVHVTQAGVPVRCSRRLSHF
jgi:hypothetical protein